jgi:hypothetical protein
MMTTTDNANLRVGLVNLDDDDGFYKSRMMQWAVGCPHMNATEFRLLTLLVDLCAERVPYRVLVLGDLAKVMPTKAVELGEEPQMMSVSTVARTINNLSAIGQLTDEKGAPLRISNRTTGEIRIAPWRSLQHDCTASRNVYDALDRAQGKEGQHPVGLGPAPDLVLNPAAPDLVHDAPDLVQAAPDLVHDAPDSVQPSRRKRSSTSQNSAPRISPPSSSPSSPPPFPAAPGRQARSSASVVQAQGRGELATPKGMGGEAPFDHSAAAFALIAELPVKTNIEADKIVDAIVRKLGRGHELQELRSALLRKLPRKVGDLTGLYLSRLHKIGSDQDSDQQPAAVQPVPVNAHVFVPNTYGECVTCGLLEANARHRVAAVVSAA